MAHGDPSLPRNRRLVEKALPWTFSISVHLLLAAAALLITWGVARLPRSEDSVLIVADFNALAYEPAAPLASDAPAPQAPAPIQDRAEIPPLEQTLRDRLQPEPLESLRLPAESSRAAARALSAFEPAATAKVSFAGLSSSNARTIVYVIDASGSMIAWLQTVVGELRRSLENLTPQQSFSVMFFQDARAIELPPGKQSGKMVRAVPEEKARALAWAQTIVPGGHTNPLVAIKRALDLKPDVIFLLSQDITGYGQFEIDQAELLALLDRLNPRQGPNGRRGTQINCIQFLDRDPLGTMEKIAAEHGGPKGYIFLTRKELGL